MMTKMDNKNEQWNYLLNQIIQTILNLIFCHKYSFCRFAQLKIIYPITLWIARNPRANHAFIMAY
jgi:hypothetical protein